MKNYFAMGICLALLQAALAGEAGTATDPTTGTIVHDRVKRLGRRCDAAFWTGTRGGVGAGLVTAFHSSCTGRTTRGRRVHYDRAATAGIDFGCSQHTTWKTAGWNT